VQCSGLRSTGHNLRVSHASLSAAEVDGWTRRRPGSALSRTQRLIELPILLSIGDNSAKLSENDRCGLDFGGSAAPGALGFSW